MDGLKQHDVPDGVETDGWTLDVRGTVNQPLQLRRSDLDQYPVTTYRGDFSCVDGWGTDDLRWRGVRVGEILDDADPAAESGFALVRAMDGEYACSFPLRDVADAVLAIELDDDPLPVVHGGPVRLVPANADSECWEQVKWVSEIRITDSRPTTQDTAKEHALSRIEG